MLMIPSIVFLLLTFLSQAISSPTLLPPKGSTSGTGLLENAIFAESALVDKETGRIFWEAGGSTNTLSESLLPRHIKTALFYAKAGSISLLLWITMAGFLSKWLQLLARIERFQASDSVRSHIVAKIPILIACWMLQRLPRPDAWLVISIIFLYLVEAYFSSTHQFLANRVDSQSVETYIEQLRNESPELLWKLRAFHYESSGWQNLLHKWLWWKQNLSSDFPTHAWWGPKRRVTHRATARFQCDAWLDKTTAGVWTLAGAEIARLAKVYLSKIIVLGNAKARANYLQQQARFVAEHGRDALAEFATSVEIKGFKPRVLVVHNSNNNNSHDRRTGKSSSLLLVSRRAFWACTFLGLTLFYRLWITRHCDEIRVLVVKETTESIASQADKGSLLSWLFSSSGAATTTSWYRSWSSRNESVTTEEEEDTFRNLMQQLKMYRGPSPDLVVENGNATKELRDADADMMADNLVHELQTTPIKQDTAALSETEAIVDPSSTGNSTRIEEEESSNLE